MEVVNVTFIRYLSYLSRNITLKEWSCQLDWGVRLLKSASMAPW